MLVLSRKVGERIHIGPDVVITLTEVRGCKVRIGIEAPDEVHIVRGEIAHLPSNRERESHADLQASPKRV